MDDFRRLDAFSDSTDDPFGSAPDRRVDWAERREPSASRAKAWHRVAGLLLALGIGGGSLALFLSFLVVNLLPVVLVCLLLLASAVIAFRFRRSSPDLTPMRLIWRVAPTVGMLYGIAIGLAFASGNSQLDTVTVIVLAGVAAIGGIVCAAGAALALSVIGYASRRHDGSTGSVAELVSVAVGSLAGGGTVLAWIISTGREALPAYGAFGPAVTLLLVGAFLLRKWRRSPGVEQADA